MLLRPGPLVTVLGKNISRRHLKLSHDLVFATATTCSNRSLTTLSRFKDTRSNISDTTAVQNRSITWYQLLSINEKGASKNSKDAVKKDSSEKGAAKNSKDAMKKDSSPAGTDNNLKTKILAKKSEDSTSAPPDGTVAGTAVLASTSGSTEGDKQAKPKESKAAKAKRIRVDLTKASLERNFITPVRAMSDFLLKPSDLDGLRKTKRRSPYENEPPITVYWRKDVETRANDVWGSKETLINEIVKREMENRRYQQNVFSVKRQLRDYLRMKDDSTHEEEMSQESGLFSPSGRVVLTAVVINASNFLFKLITCLYTGSHSMFAESIHSAADTLNQLILAYGLHKSTQRADMDHPYGYSNWRYLASLISGVGIFCVGTGLSFYHGVQGLMHPAPLEDLYWAFFVLGGSLASEGATLVMAVNAIKKGARLHNMSFTEYIMRGQDPSVNVVLLEDLAAVVGVGVCFACMGLSAYTGSHVPDAVGSLLVGGILGGVASFIIYTNIAGLVGRSIPHDHLEKINAELETDVMVRAIHDVKGIDMGNFLVRYKAEIDFDGRELTRSYLDKQDLQLMLEEVRAFKDIDELEAFMVKHGENIVDMMGGEIDRIEVKLRKKYPEIRHCDLEIL